MNDAVDRLIMERQAMDGGLAGSVVASALAHLLVVAAAVAAPFLFPREPPLKVMDGFAVVLPRGGGGTPAAEAPAPATPATVPPETAPPEPKPKPEILKPPKEEKRKGLPEPDAKKSKKAKPEKSPPPRPQAGGVPGGTGTSPKTPGISIGGPPGPGTPDGSDAGGDWYLASVQQKIWLIWTQQIKTGFNQPIGVTFTILADGSLEETVKVTQPSGVTLLDLAAQRAVYSAAPFGPLPKDYGTNRYTVQALFKPTP